MASAAARRRIPVEPSTQSSLVWFTISTIVGTPRPSSPTRLAHAASSSISAEAFDRFPSLSLRRWMRNPFRVPSGRTRGRRKQVRPAGAWARTRNASDVGAEQNHLWPVRAYSPGAESGSARVVFARTSEPPCFSVMAIPDRAPALSAGGARRGS